MATFPQACNAGGTSSAASAAAEVTSEAETATTAEAEESKTTAEATSCRLVRASGGGTLLKGGVPVEHRSQEEERLQISQ